MLAEHDQGRTYVRGMDEANKRYANGDKKALEAALDNARGYSELLRQHIDKEDNILYVMADQVLTDTKQQELLRIFGEVERERIGSGKHEEYVKLVEDLEGELGLRQV
jgi:hemerythrin-like domain-containing protein